MNKCKCKYCVRRRGKRLARQAQIRHLALRIFRDLLREFAATPKLDPTVSERPATPVPEPTPPKPDTETIEISDSEEEEEIEPVESVHFEPSESENSEPAESENSEPAESEISEPIESDNYDPIESDNYDPIESDAFEPTEPENLQPIKIEHLGPPPSTVWEPPYLLPNWTYLIPQESKTTWVEASLTYLGDPLELIEIASQKRRRVGHTQIAFVEPPDCVLRVGGRVLAGLRVFRGTSSLLDFGLRLGYVAETPKEENKYRYLIAFDLGYWMYVDVSNVRPIFETGPNDWMDISPCPYRNEVERFFTEIDADVRDVMLGETLRMRNHEGYIVGYYVLSIDGPLALLFDGLSDMQWVYLGSDRILDEES